MDPGCSSLLDRPTSTPDKEDAQWQWTGRTRCLEVAKWPRGYSGELIFHRRLLHRYLRTLATYVDGAPLRDYCECCVSLDGALNLRDVFYVLYRGLQAVWLFEMFERTPILFQ